MGSSEENENIKYEASSPKPERKIKKTKSKLFTEEIANATASDGEGVPHRCVYFKDMDLIKSSNPEVKTLTDNFLRGVKLSGKKNCLGTRVGDTYEWISYEETLETSKKLGSAFLAKGLVAKDFVGVFSVNQAEWMLTEIASNLYNMILVPLYDTLGPEAISHILNETEMKLVVAHEKLAPQIYNNKDKYPHVKTLVIMGNASEEAKQKGKEGELEVFGFNEMLELGAKDLKDFIHPQPEDLCTICYTSGTTGLPKGVELSHANFIAEVAAVDYFGAKGLSFQINKDDVHISYLPLAHVFERMVFTYLLGVGAAAGFFQGDTTKLLDDISILKPTFFPSVPRLLNKIYDKVHAGVEAAGGMKANLFHKAVKAKKHGLKNGHLTHWLWDKLVFSKVKARLGGRVRCIITASAPISPEVIDFLRLAFSCEVHEAYGQTETCGGATLTLKKDYDPGHVGVPFPCNEIKLVDVPEMNYTSKDEPFPRGEICYKGNNIFSGYYKNPEKTAEALDKDGWLHSGDIGLWDERGRLKIIDRKKNIFKLAQGEYIAPEKIENVYANNRFVAQAYMHGDSLKSYLIGIVIPDEDVLIPWAKENGIEGSFEDLCKNEDIKKMILKEMTATGSELGLKSFEQAKIISLHSVLMTVEQDLLTPTFKLKRPQAKKHFEKEINEMFEKYDAVLASKNK